MIAQFVCNNQVSQAINLPRVPTALKMEFGGYLHTIANVQYKIDTRQKRELYAGIFIKKVRVETPIIMVNDHSNSKPEEIPQHVPTTG